MTFRFRYSKLASIFVAAMLVFSILALTSFSIIPSQQASASTFPIIISSDTVVTHLIVNVGEVLQINPGVWLRVGEYPETGQIVNNGVINNEGIITIGEFGGLYNNVSALINNHGIIEESYDRSFLINNGTIQNDGKVLINGAYGLALVNAETGVIDNELSGDFLLSDGAHVQNMGSVTNYGSFRIADARLVNSGILSNYGAFNEGAEVELSGLIQNTNDGIINNYEQGTFTARQYFSNAGIINNHGMMDQDAANEGQPMTNSGLLYNICKGIVNMVVIGNQPVQIQCGSAQEAIRALENSIMELNLDDFTESRLVRPLEQALALSYLNDDDPNNDFNACGKLDRFLDKVDLKEENNKITSEQASILRDSGNQIRSLLGC